MLADTRMAYAFARDHALPASKFVPSPVVLKKMLTAVQFVSQDEFQDTDSVVQRRTGGCLLLCPQSHRTGERSNHQLHLRHHGACS